AGSYEATLPDPAPGRYRVNVRAAKGGVELGRSASEFAVDRWSLEEARAEPDSALLAALAAATGGRMAQATQGGDWARPLTARPAPRPEASSFRRRGAQAP